MLALIVTISVAAGAAVVLVWFDPSGTSTTEARVTEPLSNEQLGEAWQDVLDNLTGEMRAAGFPNPRDDPYQPTGSEKTLIELNASYLKPETGYRKQLLELFDQTDGRLPYANLELRGRIAKADGPDDMWALVFDITGFVIRPLTGAVPPTSSTVQATNGT